MHKPKQIEEACYELGLNPQAVPDRQLAERYIELCEVSDQQLELATKELGRLIGGITQDEAAATNAAHTILSTLRDSAATKALALNLKGTT